MRSRPEKNKDADGGGEKNKDVGGGGEKNKDIVGGDSTMSGASSSRGHHVCFGNDTTWLLFGSMFYFLCLPYLILQILMCTLWDFIDKHTIGLVGWCSHLFANEESWIDSNIFQRFVCHKKDGFIVPLFLWLGVILPLWFFYEMYYAVHYGLVWYRIVFYNIVRIGPMYANFMYVYVLAHKEGHLNGHLFDHKAISLTVSITPHLKFSMSLKYVFNHWVGIFHGICPGTFTYSHIYNHHKRDNDSRDVYSTAFHPRDHFPSFLRYIAIWLQYACNLSTLRVFLEDRKTKFVNGVLLETSWYMTVLGICYRIHPLFTLFTLVWAFFEGNILLAMVNYVWHGFIDEDDPSNDYINSVTIIDGLNFTLKEEYHTVHHQYAGVHWTRHEELYNRHKEDYLWTEKQGRNTLNHVVHADGVRVRYIPTAFYKCNVFVLWGMMIAKDYDGLANLYYEPFLKVGQEDDEKPLISKGDLALIFKRRLQAHGPALAEKMSRGVE